MDRLLRGAQLVLAMLGVGIAAYLTVIHYQGADPVCLAGGGGCHTVQSSKYAALAGVPVSLLGLLGYLIVLFARFIRGDAGLLAGAATAICGALFSGYLTYLELFVIDAICQWCVASAVLMGCLAAVTSWRLLRV